MDTRQVIGIDTNVLVRLIMKDDLIQYEKAFEFISNLEKSNKKGFINLVVLTELAFLLLRTYKIPKDHFINIFFILAQKSYLVLEQELAVLKTLEAFKTVNADFHDLLISFVNQSENVNITVSFDKKAASKVVGFKLL